MLSESSRVRVLLADDQPDVVAALRLLLKTSGFETEAVTSPGAVLESVQRRQFDLVLMDLNYSRDTTSGREGLELLERLQTLDGAPGVIVMTAWGSIDLAVEAMRRGARDFVTKPWDNQRLLDVVRRNLEPQPALSETRHATERDLAVARTVQRRLLPQQPPALRTLAYAAECVPAGAVGGDYYDFIDRGGGRTLFALADVSGKGIAAALLMAHLQATLHTRCADGRQGLRLLAEEINRAFFDSTRPEHFATLFLGEYEDSARRLRYVNCGHNPPLLLRADGHLESLDTTATVIGAFSRFSCEEGETRIGPGDTLAVCSDGVLEARDRDGEEFGTQRLAEVLRANVGLAASVRAAAVANAVAGFCANRQEDDLTVMIAEGQRAS